MLALEELGATLKRGDFEGAPVADVVFILTQIFGGEGGFLLGGFLLKLRDKDAVVERVHLQRDLVLSILQIVPRTRDFRCRNAILLMYAEQLRQRLGEHRAARKERLLALRQRSTPCGNGYACYAPEDSRGNRKVLELGDMQRIRFIGYGRKVSGARTLFPVLVLLDLDARDLEVAVLFDSKANRFRDFETPHFGCHR